MIMVYIAMNKWIKMTWDINGTRRIIGIGVMVLNSRWSSYISHNYDNKINIRRIIKLMSGLDVLREKSRRYYGEHICSYAK